MESIKYVLNERPSGAPDDKTWRREVEEVSAGDGQFVVENLFISMDPAMRGWIRDQPSYLPPVKIDEVMRALTVGRVVESNHDNFAVGQHVAGAGGVQTYCVTKGRGWLPIDDELAPLPVYLGTLGMSGLTAYFGLLDVGQPKAGETVLVSGAAGAVGSVVGQLAKIKGCRAVGIAGGPEKCAFLEEKLGFDSAVDYKAADFGKKLRAACPEGVDVYFDNVGGEILDRALALLNRGARIPLCGGISQYNATETRGPKNYLALLVQRAKMEGFVILDYEDRYLEAIAEMAPWVATGKLNTETTVAEGIDNFLATFNRLFSGDKRGKLVLKP